MLVDRSRCCRRSFPLKPDRRAQIVAPAPIVTLILPAEPRHMRPELPEVIACDICIVTLSYRTGHVLESLQRVGPVPVAQCVTGACEARRTNTLSCIGFAAQAGSSIRECHVGRAWRRVVRRPGAPGGVHEGWPRLGNRSKPGCLRLLVTPGYIGRVIRRTPSWSRNRSRVRLRNHPRRAAALATPMGRGLSTMTRPFAAPRPHLPGRHA